MTGSVSVLIPAFNAGAFIEQALDSVAVQTLPATEIVVVDDGSSDDTSAIVEAWAARKNIPLKLIRQENQGVPVARNRGMQAAGGDWIALLDADDIWLPRHLEVLLQATACDRQAMVFFGDTVYFGEGVADMPAGTRDAAVRAGDCLVDGCYRLEGRLFEALLPGLFFAPTSTIYRRDAALAIGGFDAGVRYIEDRDFFLRLSRQNAFVYVDEVISRNRIHESNITHPRNAVRNAFYMLKLLRQLRARSESLALTERELAMVGGEWRKTRRGLLVAASGGGLVTYLPAVGRLVADGEMSAELANPRTLLRAMYYSLHAFGRTGD